MAHSESISKFVTPGERKKEEQHVHRISVLEG
jgi:hypothetical protein